MKISRFIQCIFINLAEKIENVLFMETKACKWKPNTCGLKSDGLGGTESNCGCPYPAPMHHERKMLPRPLSSGTAIATENYIFNHSWIHENQSCLVVVNHLLQHHYYLLYMVLCVPFAIKYHSNYAILNAMKWLWNWKLKLWWMRFWNSFWWFLTFDSHQI